MNFIYTVHPIFLIVAVIGLAILWQILHDWLIGYKVSVAGEKFCDLRYSESWKGSLTLFNDGCCDEQGNYYGIVHVPSEAEWREQMPEWAKERRDEIMARIIKEIGTKEYRFPGYIQEGPRP